MGKIRKWPCMPKERCRLIKELEDLKYEPQADNQLRDSTQQ